MCPTLDDTTKMVDLFGLCASILAVAGVGYKLSASLSSFVDTSNRIDNNIKAIARDVELTASVMSELANVLQNSGRGSLARRHALKTAETAMCDCL